MARYRLSQPARNDIRVILATSQERWGEEGRRRYRALLAVALRRIAENPLGTMTRARPELSPVFRSYHIRHSRAATREHPVTHPVHVIFYRAVSPGIVEIVRVLHERSEPSRHLVLAHEV